MTAPDTPFGLTRETTIRRDRDGRWFHEGVEVTHPAIARAFDQWVDRAEDGRYCLKNAIHWAYVTIEGAPILVQRIELFPDHVELVLSDGRRERLRPETLRQSRDGALHCDAREGTMPAGFTRGAQLALEPLIGEDESGVYLEIGGARFRPPVVADPLSAPAR